MVKPLDPRFERWLAAEADDDADLADRELAAMFAELPRLAPSPGFARRVALAASGVPRRVERSLGFRWAVAVCLALVALSASFLPGLAGLLARPWADRWSPAGFLAGATEAFVTAVRGIAEAVAGTAALWQDLARLGDVLGLVAATPQVILALVFALAVATGAFRLLAGLFAQERSWSYVPGN